MPLIITSNGKARRFTTRQFDMRKIAREELLEDDTAYKDVIFSDALDEVTYDASKIFEEFMKDHIKNESK